MQDFRKQQGNAIGLNNFFEGYKKVIPLICSEFAQDKEIIDYMNTGSLYLNDTISTFISHSLEENRFNIDAKTK